MTSRGRHSKGRHLKGRDMRSRLKTVALCLLPLALAAALFVVAIPLATNGEWRTVQTASMEPHISAGDVVLLLPAKDAPAAGEIVAFPDPLQPERDVLHRVVAVDDQGALITKGDANDVIDPWTITSSEVIGTEALSIPGLGVLVQAVTSDLGIFLFLVVPALLILISEGRVWLGFIRHGSEAFADQDPGRHIAAPGKHLARSYP